MEHDPRPDYPLRCPVCGVSMVGEKPDPRTGKFEFHHCLNCGATIRVSPQPDDEE